MPNFNDRFSALPAALTMPPPANADIAAIAAVRLLTALTLQE
jgi:hypothetical protein